MASVCCAHSAHTQSEKRNIFIHHNHIVISMIVVGSFSYRRIVIP